MRIIGIKKRFKPSKRQKKVAAKRKLTRMQKFQRQLNRKPPQSEIWFRSLWKRDMPSDSNSFTMFKDEYNGIVGPYIVDILNRGFKYCIEIDGSYHNLPQQKFKDRCKDEYLTKRGYKVFRVRYCNQEEYNQTLEAIKLIKSSL